MLYTDHLAKAERSLRAARDALSKEIGAYPTPISGCDAQFNHLLDTRHRVSRALGQLAEPVFIPTPRSPARGTEVESR